MEAPSAVGTPFLEGTTETPVSVFDTPNLQTRHVRTLSDNGESFLQGALKRVLVSQLEENSRRDIGIQPRPSGRIHNHRILSLVNIVFNKKPVKILNVQFVDGL